MFVPRYSWRALGLVVAVACSSSTDVEKAGESALPIEVVEFPFDTPLGAPVQVKWTSPKLTSECWAIGSDDTLLTYTGRLVKQPRTAGAPIA